jgi:predicted ATP-dependent endonuclease of OLD family
MKLSESIEQLNSEARERDGFLTQIAQPLNDALKAWNIQIDLSVNTISTDIIIKSLINYAFIDQNINNTSFDLDRFGHGFQRSVIFELIQLASKLQKKSTPQTPDFNPDFTLLLFEEPEAFLHPAQQENMAYHLHNFGKPEGQQIIITSHSPIFVSKNSDNLGQICRIQKSNGISHIYQLKPAQKENLLEAGGDFLNVLKQYIADPTIEDSQKKDAKNFVNNAPAEEIAHQHEEFRYQLWLDPDRAAMFFADKVLLVEGASEKALFNYLLENDWNDLTQERILIIDALGKYNFHRFISLFEAYGIPHGILLDSDHNKEHHGVVNQLIRSRKNTFTQAYPFEFDEHLEKFLDLSLPKSNHQKPLQILQALYNHTLCPQKLTELRNIFCKVLNISSAQTSSHTNE